MRILIVSDGKDTRRGYSNVITNMMRGLFKISKKEYTIASVSLLCYQPEIDETNRDLANILEWRPSSENVNDKLKCLSTAIKSFKPDIILTLKDGWKLAPYAQPIIESGAKWIMYLPVDGTPYPKEMYLGNTKVNIKKILDMPDFIVTFNKFGTNAIKDIREPIKEIAHGVNSNLFTKATDEEIKMVKKSITGNAEDFLFTSVGINTRRKGFDKMIEAWALFQKKKVNAKLYLHTIPYASGAFNLEELVKYYGVKDTVFFPPGNFTSNTPFTVKDLVYLYSASDVYLNTSRAEGFCLPILEAMSCQTPIICTDYAGHTTYVSNSAYKIKVSEYIVNEYVQWKNAIIDTKDASKGMYKLYSDGALRNRMGTTARNIALGMSWDKICLQWDDLFQEVKSKSLIRGIRV